MKVVLKSKNGMNAMEYSVSWKYIDVPILYGEGSVERTICSIDVVDPAKIGKDRFSSISAGSVTRKFSELGNRSLARKLSLAKALGGTYFKNKRVRACFWEAFIKECKGPWKKKSNTKIACLASAL